MLKVRSIVFVICAAVLFTGCFDIKEKITFKKGGNGSYSLRITLKETINKNIQESMAKAAADTTGDDNFKQQTENEVDELALTLTTLKAEAEKIKGISNFKIVNDIQTFNYGYEFDFKDSEALNECMKAVFKAAKTQSTTSSSKPVSFPEQLISFKKNILTRFHDETAVSVLQMTEVKNDPKMKAALLVLSDLTYQCTYEFESEVKKYSNTAFVLSEDKKTLTALCMPFSKKKAPEGDPCSLSNVIQLK